MVRNFDYEIFYKNYFAKKNRKKHQDIGIIYIIY